MAADLSMGPRSARIDVRGPDKWTDSGAALHISTDPLLPKSEGVGKRTLRDDPCRHRREPARPRRRAADRDLPACRRGARPTYPATDLQALSQWYQTAPIPPSGPAALRQWGGPADGPVEPAAAARAASAIERREGRVRGTLNAARTLDLDIVAIGELIRTAPDPVLPHPRAHLRAFVLVPLRGCGAGLGASRARPTGRGADRGVAAAADPPDLNGSFRENRLASSPGLA